MEGKIRTAAAGLTATLIALFTAFGAASSALAHTSAFTGHYTLSGENWQLVYKGPLDQYTSNCGGSGHFHDVNHNYRSVPNQGPYNFYHQQYHYVGCSGVSRSVGELSAEPVPAPQPSPAELAEARDAAEARRTLCSKYEVFCDGDTEAHAEAVVKRIRSGYPVRVLTLTGVSVFGGEQYFASETRQPPAGACVINLLDLAGYGPVGVSDLQRGITAEVVDPARAERLGHTC